MSFLSKLKERLFKTSSKIKEGVEKTFDGIGAFFQRQFDKFIVQPIKAVWDVIAPDWVKSIDFKWSDLFPPALTKLFGGEYFTVDFPTFSWTDLFPQFLVDLFNNVAIAGKETTFEWKDLLPEFFKENTWNGSGTEQEGTRGEWHKVNYIMSGRAVPVGWAYGWETDGDNKWKTRIHVNDYDNLNFTGWDNYSYLIRLSITIFSIIFFH